MEFGAYFIPESEWNDARAAGLDWCAWPPIIPDKHGTGEGFVCEKVIVDLRTGEKIPYTRDEIPTPAILRDDPDGSFVTLGRRELGLNAKDLPARFQRAIVNYFLCDHSRWRTIEKGVLTAHRCAEAWEGTPWTAVVNTNDDLIGKLDAASETQSIRIDLLWDQVEWYWELGASRIFWWRWDTPKGLVGIDEVMTKVRTVRKRGKWLRGRLPL